MKKKHDSRKFGNLPIAEIAATKNNTTLLTTYGI